MFENVPYAMTPAAYAELRAAVERAAAGGPVAALSFGNTKPALPAESGGHVAVIPITGVLLKNPSEFAKRLGASSTLDIHDEFERAMQDPNVHAIVLHTDSPGGTVDGAHALAEHIYQSRNRGKQIHAYVDGMAGSAAYWVVSAAHKVHAATPSTNVGSIGVISQHVDRSAALGAAGLKLTELTSGPFKNAGSPNSALSDPHRAELQRHVDELHAQFAGNVARNRGMTSAAVAKVADGRVFLGHEAVAHGLADGVARFQDVVNKLGKPQHREEYKAAAPQLDVAARARVWAAQQEELGRRVTAVESINHVLGVR